ncbi:DinB family protein [Jatrophihabitans sp. DSM 45814]
MTDQAVYDESAKPAPDNPVPDEKDWTWVLDQACPECGFDARTVSGRDVPAIVRDAVIRWGPVLRRSDAAQRPGPQVWSALEYGCHVRDVFARFDSRARLMLAEDDPLFENWDQDATALADRYWEQAPATVAVQLADAGEQIAATFDAVDGAEWQRTGRRSNGSVFTVDSLGKYFAHDIVHHLADVQA